jgi:hypothetical protein
MAKKTKSILGFPSGSPFLWPLFRDKRGNSPCISVSTFFTRARPKVHREKSILKPDDEFESGVSPLGRGEDALHNVDKKRTYAAHPNLRAFRACSKT